MPSKPPKRRATGSTPVSSNLKQNYPPTPLPSIFSVAMQQNRLSCPLPLTTISAHFQPTPRTLNYYLASRETHPGKLGHLGPIELGQKALAPHFSIF